jgi:phenylalanyl-tRNA synthetase alpha chain
VGGTAGKSRPFWDGFFVKRSNREDPMDTILGQIQKKALIELENVSSEKELSQWQVHYLGRSSSLMEVFKKLGELSPEERPLVGKQANVVKQALETALEEKKENLRQLAIERSLGRENIDVTLPGRPIMRGRIHPATYTMREIYRIFGEMGFQVYRSREIETDAYNFEMLNIPAHHPARDMWDTFHTTVPGQLLRTHTSPGQIRYMHDHAPEAIRVILPGMCYRYEQVSTRYELQFTQVEGLAVGRSITFGDLKGTLSDFARRMFGKQVRARFRASHFPFTEPSAEMDIECFLCGGEGCSVCKGTGWLEILGCGMVHPTVLKNGGYDPRFFTGFAFGLGPERITMLRHRIEDIRYFWANDLRFLEQF